MLPRDGRGLPAWRAQVMPLVMLCLRAAVTYSIFRGTTAFLWAPPALLHLSLGARLGYGALLVIGAPTFLWPRSCFLGGALLAMAVGVYEWVWRHAGLPAGGMPWMAVALIAVLVLGNAAADLARRRLYGDDTRDGVSVRT